MFLGRAPEWKGITGWVNGGPLTLAGLRGKVVLLDFWTYSCVNCLRTLPHLTQLWERYKDHGFVLIGVHTPEFAFEKDPENVKKAVEKHGIPYPIALDPENACWKQYGNRYWPRQTLIDHRGRVAWEHTGEGGYREMEEWIRKLLELAGKKIPSVGLPEDGDLKGYFSHAGISPELYAGSDRATGLGSSGVCGPDGVCRFLDQSRKHERDVLYPDGEWVQRREFLFHTGKGGSLTLRFFAREANVVLEGNTAVDVVVDGKKKKQLAVEGADMYRLLAEREPEERELRLVFAGPCKVYAFTFG